MNYMKSCDRTNIKTDINNSKLKKLTTFVVCLSPVLCIYRVLGIFMLGEVVLIILLFANMLATFNISRFISYKQSSILLFAIVILLISIFGYLANGLEIYILPRLIRLLFCLFMAIFLGGNFFDYKYASKYIIFIAVIATILIVFQKIYNDATGEFIYFISKGNIYSPAYDSAYFENVESLSMYRPMSIFLEPSHYCQYILFALTIVLFKYKLSVKDVLIAVLFSIGIFISTSSTGVILCSVLWIIYLFSTVKDNVINRNLSLKMFFIIALVLISAIVILSLLGDDFLYAIQRIYKSNSSSSPGAWEGRMGTFSIFFESSRLTDLLFGRGYGVINENEWYASIPYYYSGTGMIGMLAIVSFFTSMYLLSNRYQRKLLFVFFVMCFVTEVLTNYWLIFVLSLIMTATEDKGIEKQ